MDKNRILLCPQSTSDMLWWRCKEHKFRYAPMHDWTHIAHRPRGPARIFHTVCPHKPHTSHRPGDSHPRRTNIATRNHRCTPHNEEQHTQQVCRCLLLNQVHNHPSKNHICQGRHSTLSSLPPHKGHNHWCMDSTWTQVDMSNKSQDLRCKKNNLGLSTECKCLRLGN